MLNGSESRERNVGIRSLAVPALRAAGLLLLAAVLLGGLPAPKAHGATTVIQVGDFWFCSPSYQFGNVCPTTVAVGDTVEWDFNGVVFAHTSTDCGPTNCTTGPFGGVWHSGTLSSGTFQHTFTQPGVYPYYCALHPSDMLGQITVTSAAVGGIAELPLDGASVAPVATADSAGGLNLSVIARIAAVGALVLISLAALARRRLLD